VENNILDWFQIFVLSLVQGITEFLPVSSSAHLILVPKILGWEDQGLAFDIAVHVGTLMAVLSYFRKDLYLMLRDFVYSLGGRNLSEHAKMAWFIGFATIPVGLTGLLAKNFIETELRSPLIIALATIAFGFALWLADKWGRHLREKREANQSNEKGKSSEIDPLQTIHWKDMVAIGCSQALSLIPGTSRSGITLTAGLAMGLTRETAARFSFLLSIPVILLAGGLETVTLIKSPTPVNWLALGSGALLSAGSGYICIHYFIKLINKTGVFPFVLYRVLLGLCLIWFFY
jgi:undecaprenyl-diphosphatase